MKVFDSECNICIVPARGGSKRLPRKNIHPFLGRPIIDYTVEAARESGLFARIIVSTEDREIGEVARAAGAEVYERPEHLATDQAGVVEVCLQTLEVLAREGMRPARLCCLYATAPMRTAADITGALQLMETSGANGVMAVTCYSISPCYALMKNPKGYLSFVWPEMAELKSQQLPEIEVDNGSTYWVDVEAFIEQKTFYTDRLIGYWMPPERSIDIDTADDLVLAEYYARRLLHGSNPKILP